MICLPGPSPDCLSVACRYYKTQQAGYNWTQSGTLDPNALAELKEDSQRTVSGSKNIPGQ